MRPAKWFRCSGCGKYVIDETMANMAVQGIPCVCGTLPSAFATAGDEELGQGADDWKERVLSWEEIIGAAAQSMAIANKAGEPLVCRCGSFYFRIGPKGLHCTACDRSYEEKTLWVENTRSWANKEY